MWGCEITYLIAVHVVLCQPLNLSTYLTFSANGKKETHCSLYHIKYFPKSHSCVTGQPLMVSDETSKTLNALQQKHKVVFFFFKISYSYIVNPSGVLQAITERYL